MQEYIKDKQLIIFTNKYIKSGAIVKNNKKKKIFKEQRFIMVHAGGKSGFISNTVLMFRSGNFGHE